MVSGGVKIVLQSSADVALQPQACLIAHITGSMTIVTGNLWSVGVAMSGHKIYHGL